MKTIFIIAFVVVATAVHAQSKIDTIQIQIPARQMQKIAELDRMEKEIKAKREDLLLDILAIPENEVKINGAKFVGVIRDKIKFIKP